MTSANLINVTAADFEQHVISASHEKFVLVDFWADWCNPCKMLMPILEKLAEEMGDKILLVKVNADEEQELANKYSVRSLPTVQLFHKGELLDQFSGALPETQIRAFLERHLPQEADLIAQSARELAEQGDVTAAFSLLKDAIEKAPDNKNANLAYLELSIDRLDLDQAEKLLNNLPLTLAEEPEFKKLRTRLDFTQITQGAPNVEALLSKLQANENDSESRHLLGTQYVIEQRYEEAMQEFLTLMRKDRNYGDKAAHKALLAVFELLEDSALINQYRRQLSALLL